MHIVQSTYCKTLRPVINDILLCPSFISTAVMPVPASVKVKWLLAALEISSGTFMHEII